MIKPEKIKVTGVRGEVERLTDVTTEVIDISRINESRSFEAGIVNTSFDANAFSETTVKVTVQVADSRINHRFSSFPWN